MKRPHIQSVTGSKLFLSEDSFGMTGSLLLPLRNQSDKDMVKEIIFYSTYQHVKGHGNELKKDVTISSVMAIAQEKKK